MVQVEEVQDAEDYLNDPATDIADGSSEDGWESEDEFNPSEETIYDRVVALKDIVPPQTRSALVVNYARTKSWLEWGLGQAGNIAWIVSTSALLVGLPLALAIEDETRITQQEREMQMQSQGQQQVSSSHRGGEEEQMLMVLSSYWAAHHQLNRV